MPAAVPPAAHRAAPGEDAGGGAAADVLGRFAKGAGLPLGAVAATDPGRLAEQLGRLMLLVTDNLKQLLSARSQTKSMAGSSGHTMIAALDNNPLKFSPTAADALRIMLGPATTSYLPAEDAIRQSFDDLKSHQVKMLAAMQQALQRLIEDIEPKAIEAGLGETSGLASQLGFRRSRLWALYESRWRAKTSRHGGGLHDLFMQYFAECYDRLPDSDAEPHRPGRTSSR